MFFNFEDIDDEDVLFGIKTTYLYQIYITILIQITLKINTINKARLKHQFT